MAKKLFITAKAILRNFKNWEQGFKMNIDFSKEFDREMRLWRRNAQIDAVKYTLKFLAVVFGMAAICVFWIAVLWGFLATNF